MAGLTLVQAEARLAEYLAAESKVLEGQSYQIGQRSLTRADLKEIREGVTYWDGLVRRLSAGGSRGMRIRGGTPT